MTYSTSTDQTYLVSTGSSGVSLAVYEVDAENVTMAIHYATSMCARDADISAADVDIINVRLKPTPTRHCLVCGTPESSTHTSNNRCCWNSENLVED